MGRFLAALGAFLVLTIAGQAMAQSLPPQLPMRSAIDSNGVDLFSHRLVYDRLGVSIGTPGSGQLSATVNIEGGTEYTGQAVSTSGAIYVNIGSRSVGFHARYIGGSYVILSEDGSGVFQLVGSNYIYTQGDGTEYTFSIHDSFQYIQSGYTAVGVLNKIVKPDGEVITINLYHDPTTGVPRVASVSNNYNYQIQFGYSPYGPLTRMVAFNKSIASCAATADASSCSLSGWPEWNASGNGGYTLVGRYISPSSADPNFVTLYDGRAAYGVSWGASDDDGTYFNALGTWQYHKTSSGVEITDPLGHLTTYGLDFGKMLVTSYTDALGRVTTYHYDSDNRPDLITAPDGHKAQFAYDYRGNVVTTTQVAATGSGVSNIVTSATYPTICTPASSRSCNKPSDTTDALGKVTNYTYDGTTGQLLTVTAPSPGSGAARPETRYSYYTGSGVKYLTQISTCMSGSAPSCVGTANETVTSFGSRNANLQPLSMTIASGNGAVSATTAYTYDVLGDLATTDGPLSGTGDTTRMRYDLAQRLVSTVGPDPDGVGARKPQASHIAYGVYGQVTAIEIGTVDSVNDDPASALAVYQTEASTYDDLGGLAGTFLSNGGVIQAVTQYASGIYGVTCVAQRMNPAAFGSLPGACTATTAGPDGPDRITKYLYDNAGAPTVVRDGCDSSTCLRDFSTTAYSSTTGQVTSVTDARGNATSYTYDGLGRAKRVTYADSSYEAADFHNNGQLSQMRRRDGSNFWPVFDDLGRQTNTPGSLTIGYDNGGQVISAGGLTDAYDALGRQVSAVSALGTVSYTYDAAGRRTRMDYPGGFYVTYDWDTAGNLTAIRLNGGSAIVTYAYDGIGRRVGQTFANGATTTYVYDAASRLSDLDFDLPGTNGDQQLELSYNPIGQIRWRSYSNGTYDPGLTASSASYSANSVNQINGLAYTGNGDLWYDGIRTYGYDNQSRLVSVGGSAGLEYDAWDRLVTTYSASTGTKQFLYDGDDLIAEYDGSGALLRRYVHGPGDNEPLAWYEGSGTGNVKYLTLDERGSVAAISDSATTVFSYDPYGQPGSSNTGRFGYTGQAWVPEAGLYYYKARFYNPHLGRFMTTDPMGYAAGDMNLYAYVGDDPVNRVDPMGMQRSSIQQQFGCPSGTIAVGDGCASRTDVGNYLDSLGNSGWNISQCQLYPELCLPPTDSTAQADQSAPAAFTFSVDAAALCRGGALLVGTGLGGLVGAAGGVAATVGTAGPGAVVAPGAVAGGAAIGAAAGAAAGGACPKGPPVVFSVANPLKGPIADFRRQLAASGKAPKWMNQWLRNGRSPPGHQVDHLLARSVGGGDHASNLRLKTTADHINRHRFYRPWEK